MTLWNHGSDGLTVQANGSGVQILNSILRNNGGNNKNGDGIGLVGASSITITNNQIIANAGYGIDSNTNTNNLVTISTNLIKGNGTAGAAAQGANAPQIAGIGIRVGTNFTISQNIITANAGDGIVVKAGQTGNRITQNSIFLNAELGIDLGGSDASNGGNNVSGNDGAKPNTTGNSGMDYPIFSNATISGATLTIQGFVGSLAGQNTFANATIEIFKVDNDNNNNGEIVAGDTFARPHGEGKTYIGTITARSEEHTSELQSQ